MAPANQCISMFVEALLFRPGWRHLTPGEGGEMNTFLTNPEERTRTPRRHHRACLLTDRDSQSCVYNS